MSVELRPIADRKAGLNVSSKMEALSAEQDSLEQKGSLSQALDDVDATIARLMEARNTMVTGMRLTIQSCIQADVLTKRSPKCFSNPSQASESCKAILRRHQL